MYISLLARVLLIIGGINYLFFSLLCKNKDCTYFIRILYSLIGFSALYLMFNRDYYLPFLGKCVIPVGPKKPSENLVKIKLSNLPPNTYVMYWGSKKSEAIFENPIDAYKDYSNNDIGKTDNNGDIIIELECPSKYKVSKFGLKRELKRHIHYRFELPEYKGLFSKVYTKEISC